MNISLHLLQQLEIYFHYSNLQAFQQQQQREFQERLIEQSRVAQQADIMAQQVERERQQKQDQVHLNVFLSFEGTKFFKF